MTSSAVREADVAAPAAASAPPAGRGRRRGRSDLGWALVFVLPLFAGIALFYLWPIVRNLWFSFTEWGPFGDSEWVGLDNYIELAGDATMGRAILNTLGYTAMLLCGVPLAIYFASLLNRPGLRFANLFRTAFFLPYVAMPAAISMVWRIIYNGDFGILNYALSLIGIDGPSWLSTEGVALVAVALVGIWISLGFNLIILSAGMKGIPVELYEAASLDGATRWKQFTTITVPLLTPSIFFVSVMTVIAGFQVFDLLYALMGTQNPAIDKTQSVVYYFFTNIKTGDNGYAAAIGVVILLLVGIFTLLQFRLQKKWVTYV
ncbi:carbohydrate ABC transporter permease [Agromyces cerinus]|uniref:Carbohydrate ABC transporter membrane protein 1, CUT1 family n=1 Tax=Agromyces cerinus subsp. cerinus TaxID=232089 RepID=A0A1N6FC06_9MICO|nr:sugar ABC transporter permease [Agromyces cerinus]SIN92790.1 carbohydrate ABC transporter membrane protein 1, CUT1 family [Agromyces cerinus subsp. cerinus]